MLRIVDLLFLFLAVDLEMPIAARSKESEAFQSTKTGALARPRSASNICAEVAGSGRHASLAIAGTANFSSGNLSKLVWVPMAAVSMAWGPL
jgi:hypothetical protein